MSTKISQRWPALLAISIASAAGAQETPPLEAQPHIQIEEITVSAQRRAQASQKLGVTLSVIDELAIQRGLLSSLPDVATHMTNVQIFEDFGGQAQPVWVIRGVGLQDFNANNTPTAAVYVDEVYQSSTVQGSSGLFDTQQVEVLKGPQGGLYGRNTSGGVVRQLSKRATLDEYTANISLGLGSWNETQLSSAVNMPVSEASAIRVAGRWIESQDAWQTSIPAGEHHGEKDSWDLRAWWLTELSAKSRIEFKLYGGENNSELPLAHSVGLYDLSGNYCAAVLAGYRDNDSCVNYAGLVEHLGGGGNILPPVSAQSRNGSRSLSNAINALDNDYLGASAYYTADIDLRYFGPARLELIANKEAFHYGMTFDYDASPTELGHQVAASDIDTHSLELRLLSQGGARLQWQLGALIANESFTEDRQFYLADNAPVGLVRGQLDYEQSTQSRALYGQGEYELSDSWQLTGSLRYSEEQKRYRDGSVRAPAFPAPFDLLAGDLNANYSLKDHWSGSIGTNWQMTDSTLLYGSASKGFKAGGFFGGFVFDALEFAPYGEESVNAYEVGTKTLFADSRLQLNTALFWYDYRDVQGFRNVSVNPPHGGATLVLERLANLGDAEHSGVDVDVTWLLGKAWSITAGLSYLDARITDSDATTVNLLEEVVSVKGERAYSPHWSSFASVHYARTVSDRFELEGQLAWHYRSDFSGHLSSNVDRAVSSLPGYGLVNAYIGLSPSAGKWSVSLWVKNLTNKVYTPRKVYDSVGSYVDIMGQSRSAGIEARIDW